MIIRIVSLIRSLEKTPDLFPEDEDELCLFLHKNICCGYSLESSRRCDSNEYAEAILMSTTAYVFYGELTKIILELSSNTLLVCCTEKS